MKKNIVVIFGSRSTEHDISIISALQVINALDKEKYDVLPIYITSGGKWLCGKKLLQINTYKNFCEKGYDEVGILPSSNHIYYKKFGKFKIGKVIDFAFIVCHGKNGEDGTIQGLLELSQIPYSSSGILGSSIGLNKIAMKRIFEAYKLPICKFVTLSRTEFDNNGINKVIENISPPVIVKPCNLGSSIGISVCNTKKELFDAVKLAFLFDRDVLVEQLVEDLTEVNISVLGDREDAVCSITEEPNNKGLLSFDKKYLTGIKNCQNKNGEKNGMNSCSRTIPANITKKQKKQIELLSLAIFDKLECKGIVRIDFLIDNITKKVYVNEINTIPGSFAFYLWEQSGLPFDKLLDRVVEIGLKHFKQQNELTISFASSVLNQNNGIKNA